MARASHARSNASLLETCCNSPDKARFCSRAVARQAGRQAQRPSVAKAFEKEGWTQPEIDLYEALTGGALIPCPDLDMHFVTFSAYQRSWSRSG